MVSQTLEDKLGEFLGESGKFAKTAKKVDTIETKVDKIETNVDKIETNVDKILYNHLSHIEDYMGQLCEKNDIKYTKPNNRVLKK